MSTDLVAGDLRRRMVLALDVDDLVVAERLAKALAPWFATVKVGLELWAAAGPDAVAALRARGFEVMADLKLHDIPTTVGRTARVVGALGVRYLTLHAFGGAVMLQEGTRGLAHGAEEAGLPPPTALAVTVLTSDADAPAHVLPRRVETAMEAGCGGVVCAAADVASVKRLAPRFVAVVPGIRAPRGERHDQARAATPAAALAAGADLLVVGRAVTAHPDPPAAARALVAGLEPVAGGG